MMKKILKTTIYIMLICILIIVSIQKISNNKISLFGYRIFRVISQSMQPEYNVNDILLVKEKKIEEINIGDNISYIGQIQDNISAIITHKVINIENGTDGDLLFHTKGNANIEEDPIVRENQIYGVVIAKLNILSIVNKLINNIYGYIIFIIIPILYLIFKNVRELILMFKENTHEK